MTKVHVPSLAFILGLCILPPLSYTGYYAWSLEYLAVLTLSFLGGAGLWALFQTGTIGRALVAGLVWLTLIVTTIIYFGAAFEATALGLSGFFIAALALYYALIRHTSTVVALAGLAALAQIAVAAIQVPASRTVLVQNDFASLDRPTVIHLLLDEHAAIAAFPSEVVSASEVAALRDVYIRNRFTVFERAYSADTRTYQALARFMNLADEAGEIHFARRETGPSEYILQEAATLEALAQSRPIDLTWGTYIAFDKVMAEMPNIARSERYDGFVGAQSIGKTHPNPKDRAIVAGAAVVRWMETSSRSNLVKIFLASALGPDIFISIDPATRTQPLVAMELLEDLIARVDCCVARGTYVFLHLLMPHHPYIFDRNCAPRPVSGWLNSFSTRPTTEPNTLQTRAERYRQHYAQALCLSQRIDQLVAALEHTPEMQDAVIILHADHGSRIALIADRGDTLPGGYTRYDYERDMRGGFMAVRLSGQREGGVVETPARIDKVLEVLVKHDFARLAFEDIEPTNDSPYPIDSDSRH